MRISKTPFNLGGGREEKVGSARRAGGEFRNSQVNRTANPTDYYRFTEGGMDRGNKEGQGKRGRIMRETILS